jgi:hypothetical protein
VLTAQLLVHGATGAVMSPCSMLCRGATAAASVAVACAVFAAAATPAHAAVHRVHLRDSTANTKTSEKSPVEALAEVPMAALADLLDVTLLEGERARALCPNPHAASQGCKVDLVVTCCPTGSSAKDNHDGTAAWCNASTRVHVVPAFYTGAALDATHGGSSSSSSETDSVSAGPAFRARWRVVSGDEAATHGTCTAIATLNDVALPLTPIHILVTPLPRRARGGGTGNTLGFARVAANKQYFTQTVAHATGVGSTGGAEHDGQLLFPVGPNLAWSGGTNSTRPFYGPALDALAAAGASYVRLWLGPSQVAASPFSDTQLQRKLGEVDPVAANNFDFVIERCEANGIHALVALESYNSLCTNTVYYCA